MKKLANVQIFETIEAATSKLLTDFKGILTDKAPMDVSQNSSLSKNLRDDLSSSFENNRGKPIDVEIAGYRLTHSIGKGAYGNVFRCVNGQSVYALKVLSKQ